MKFIIIVVPVLLILCIQNVFAFNQADSSRHGQQKHSLHKVVIDAGHGGKDYGTSGKLSHEKDVALAVALKLERTINESLPELEVYMTRTTDVFDHVTIKAKKANAVKGDLFISIHCNEAPAIHHSEIIGYHTKTYKKKGKKYTKQVPEYKTWTTPSLVKGTETYLWGVAKTGQKEEALIENGFFALDSANDKELSNFDPNDPTQRVSISLRVQQYAERSRNLALTVEDEFVKSGRNSRGAKQRDEKGIWVLQAVNMPAILIEIGFLSNPEEEEYLNSDQGQQEVCDGIVRALKRYKYSLDNKMSGNN